MKKSLRVLSRLACATAFVSMIIVGGNIFAMEIIGHRGASHDAPENTLASFKLGYKQNADADELDIYLTKDNKVIVMHDATTKRTGGVDKKIVDQTFDEIRQQNVGNWGQWKDKGYNEKAPALSEVLQLIPDGKRLFIEIKCHSEILPELEKVFNASDRKPEQEPMITFHYDVAKNAKAKFPNHEVYWLHAWGKDKKTRKYPKIDDLIKQAKDANLDGLDLQSGFPIDKDFVKKVHDAGLKLYTWTVDDPEVARKEMKAGVDGITTNRPGWMREQLTKAAQ